MCSSINSARQPANYGQSRVSELVREFFCGFDAVMCGAPRADDADGVMVALLQFTPDVKHNWRRMNLAERLGIRRRLLSNDRSSEFANSVKLRAKIDTRFPVADLIGHLTADSFDFSKVVALRREDLLRFFEYLQ